MKERSEPRPLRARVTLLLVTGAVLGIAFVGVRWFAEFSKVSEPIGKLKVRQGQIIDEGAVLDGTVQDYTAAEFLPIFKDSEYGKPNLEMRESAAIADSILANSSIIEEIKSYAAGDVIRSFPAHDDFLLKQNSLATKRVSASLRTYVGQAIATARIDDAIRACEVLFEVQDSLLLDPSEESMVFWFGVNTDLIKNISLIAELDGLTGDQRKRLVSMIGPEISPVSLRDLAVRHCTEMIAITRQLHQLDEELVSTLVSITEGNEVPDSVNRKEVRDAMESTLIQAWLDSLPILDSKDSPEMVGVKFDAELMKVSDNVQNIENEYMLLAMPVLFEQFGRMSMRVLQARAAVLAQIEGELAVGKRSMTMSGIDVAMEVEDRGDHWVITNPVLAGQTRRYRLETGLEVTQQCGVRLFVAKN